MATSVQTIELRADKLAHLFDPFDPFPTPTRDLSKSAEDFIVGWARELPPAAPLRIVIHLAEETLAAEELSDAVAHHFAYRAERVRGDLHELFAIGRTSLLIGLTVLGVCIVAGSAAQNSLGDAPLGRILSESLIILGWVANWRPIEIFLYDWWPLAARRRLLQRLAEARVEVRPPPAR
jgi:hypothetical protein